ncbi:BTE_HP_G0136640.mRNA.1.CDS.1 [Saccharomyces cerevisiae]|nr:BTE_HP_G0136640.mRNA.1.CDS.1 [Saccharomyces cerevisiae]CAI7000654.1 BTE_HP_G0136640.mRNA.1.CDS.1 [Saccharomyces cerevisiae]
MLQRISSKLHRRFLSGLLRVKHYPLRRILLPLILLQIIIITFIWSNSPQRNGLGRDADYLLPNYNELDSDDDSWYSILTSSFKNDRKIQFAKTLYENLKFGTNPKWVNEYTLQNDLLSVKMGPRKGSKLESVDELKFYDFDPRLTWSVVLNHLQNNDADQPEKLPFSWYDWTTFHELNKLISIDKTVLPCNFLFQSAFDKESLEAIETELGEPLFLYERPKYAQKLWYKAARNQDRIKDSKELKKHCSKLFTPDGHGSPKGLRFNTQFQIKELYDKVRPEVYQLQARNYILTTQSHPLSISIIESDNSTYQVPLQTEKSKNLVQSGLLQEYINDNINSTNKRRKKNKQDVEFNHNRLFQEFVNNDQVNSLYKLEIEETDKFTFDKDLVYLSPSDFKFDASKKIEELEEQKKLYPDKFSAHNENYLNSLKNSVKTSPALQRKFFYEADAVKQYKGMGFHRDKRFFNVDTLINDKQEYQARLNSMIRTFQKFTKANGIISWLSHGTLYGYLYNGMAFPWDNDFDLQMPIKHLQLLSQYFNQSLILEDPRQGNGRYFLDVSDSLTVRINGNGKNNIDARFIDVDTGLYIDITGLASTSAPSRDYLNSYIEERLQEEHLDINNIPESNGETATLPDKVDDGLVNMATLNITELRDYITSDENKNHKRVPTDTDLKDLLKKELEELPKSKTIENKLNPKQRYFLNEKLKLYNCRNNHFISFEELSPLINTVFHGVPALIPHRHTYCLHNEYHVPDRYAFDAYKNTAYLPEFRFWFDYDGLKKCSNINSWYPNIPSINSWNPNLLKEISSTKFESKLFDSNKVSEYSFKNLSMDDVRLIYKNIPKAGFIEVFTNLYNSFNVTAYRQKELEIQYCQNLTFIEKKKLLHQLRINVAPKLSSPAKDPFLFGYEKAMWKDLSKSMNQTTLDQVTKIVHEEYVGKIIDLSESLKYRNFTLFNITFDETGTTLDDNTEDYTPANTVEVNPVDFKSNLNFSSNSFLDLNSYGLDLFAPTLSDVNRKGIQMFDKDPIIVYEDYAYAKLLEERKRREKKKKEEEEKKKKEEEEKKKKEEEEKKKKEEEEKKKKEEEEKKKKEEEEKKKQEEEEKKKKEEEEKKKQEEGEKMKNEDEEKKKNEDEEKKKNEEEEKKKQEEENKKQEEENKKNEDEEKKKQEEEEKKKNEEEEKKKQEEGHSN